MPGKVKVKILAGRNLPIMDRSSDTTDAYVEIKLGSVTQKTDVYRKSLNPQWNSEWFIFEVDDADLQDEPLQIRLMDYDTYSANDAIGKVYLDLNPLLMPHASQNMLGRGNAWTETCTVQPPGGVVLSGWLPVFDTMHGMRGEVSIIVKVVLFSDVNKFRQSSCGVQFFSTPSTPCGFKIQMIHGFVKELVVNDDPEYQWIDKIRTPRASNEARQTLFSQLSGEVRRKIGLKVLELGGNAVVGYRQLFDLEGETGLVVRGIGTAVTLVRSHTESGVGMTVASGSDRREHHGGRESPRCIVAFNTSLESGKQSTSQLRANSPAPAATTPTPTTTTTTTTPTSTTAASVSASEATPSKPALCQRRSSDSEINVTPKGGTSLPDSVGSSSGGCSMNMSRLPPRQNSVPASGSYPPVITEAATLEVLEYPFLTMTNYPLGFIIHLGGTVSARSVKILLDRINNAEAPETRDNWWTEIRMEIRSHARALGCNAILGYEEHTSICEEVCVLSAAGTAAIVNLQPHDPESVTIPSAKDLEYKRDSIKTDIHHGKPTHVGYSGEDPKVSHLCRICHIPYSKASIPFPIKLTRCGVCRKGKVPDVLIATIEPPAGVAITGRGCLIQARLCRPKRDESRGDQQAKEVSDGLPFLEYELHRQLINKLRLKGMNAIFGLRVQVSIGERHMVGVATGTAVFLSCLPTPSVPTVGSANPVSKQAKLAQFQKILTDAQNANRDHFGLKSTAKVFECEGSRWSDSDDSDEEATDLDLSAGNKDTCVLEIDDAEDVDVIELLIDPQPVDGFDVVTTESVPGLPSNGRRRYIQAFTRVWKGKIPVTQAARQFNRCFEMILRSICFKLRKMRPCVICNLQFTVDLPEEDEIQITVIGTTMSGTYKVGLEHNVSMPRNLKGSFENEMIFHLEEDGQASASDQAGHPMASNTNRQQVLSSRSQLDKTKANVHRERQPVDITSLMRLPGSRIERYMGHLNFFFIRESTSIREDGGLSGFMQSFITEVLAIVRAHVSALGGNAMVSYFMTECVLLHNPHKNQGQCLINVGGDVVQAARCTDKEA